MQVERGLPGWLEADLLVRLPVIFLVSLGAVALSFALDETERGSGQSRMPAWSKVETGMERATDTTAGLQLLSLPKLMARSREASSVAGAGLTVRPKRAGVAAELLWRRRELSCESVVDKGHEGTFADLVQGQQTWSCGPAGD